jgi:hypothetical protein
LPPRTGLLSEPRREEFFNVLLNLPSALAHILAALLQAREQGETIGGVLQRRSFGQLIDRSVDGFFDAYGGEGVRRFPRVKRGAGSDRDGAP